MATSDSAVLLSMGRQGGTTFADTSAHVGPWCAISCVTPTVFSAFAGDNCTGFTGITFPANFSFYVPINSFTLTSGTVLAYAGTIA